MNEQIFADRMSFLFYRTTSIFSVINQLYLAQWTLKTKDQRSLYTMA